MRRSSVLRCRFRLLALVLLALGACGWWRGRHAASPANAALNGRDRLLAATIARNETEAGAPEPFSLRLRHIADTPRGPARTAKLEHLLEAWATVDPAAAAHSVLVLTDPVCGVDALGALFKGWATRHPEAAVDWLLAEPAASRAAWARLAFTLLDDAPSALADLAVGLAARDPAQSAGYLGAALAVLDGAGNFSVASSLIARASDPLVRDSLGERLVADWARTDPRATGAWLLSLAPAPERDALLGRLAATWSAAQPQAAAEFAVALPDGLGRTHALTLAFEAWLARDAAAASDWLGRLAPEPALDTPVFALATTPAVAAAYPAVAAAWAERIANPDVRLQGLRTVMENWVARDLEAARRFLLATPALSDDFRRTLLAEFDHS